MELIIEKGNNGSLWGRVLYEDDLITDEATSFADLEEKIRKALRDFHNVENASFTYSYDLSSFFDAFDYLKISKIAERAGINTSLLRHYAAGSKTASAEQVGKIENAVHALAQELAAVSLVAA
ncbi:MAG: hypothetical protein J7576_02465 [Siphonobacter aquaeclarae]|nr:hypothetical protein [Siphonobacter aquaeclarae]